MIESFRQFSIAARTARVRVVCYAGHGVQVKRRNYLLPVDAEIRGEDEMPAKGADLTELLERLGAAAAASTSSSSMPAAPTRSPAR